MSVTGKTTLVILVLAAGLTAALLFRKPSQTSTPPEVPATVDVDSAATAAPIVLHDRREDHHDVAPPVSLEPSTPDVSPAKVLPRDRRSDPADTQTRLPHPADGRLRPPPDLAPTFRRALRPPLPVLSEVAASGLPGAPATPPPTAAHPIAAEPAAHTVDAPLRDRVGSSPAAVRKHTLADGDTLRDLAGRYLGNPGRAQEIYELNRDVLSSAELLRIGTVVKLPARVERVPPPVERGDARDGRETSTVQRVPDLVPVPRGLLRRGGG